MLSQLIRPGREAPVSAARESAKYLLRAGVNKPSLFSNTGNPAELVASHGAGQFASSGGFQALAILGRHQGKSLPAESAGDPGAIVAVGHGKSSLVCIASYGLSRREVIMVDHPYY